MKTIPVKTLNNSYYLRKVVKGVVFQKCWGTVGNPDDYAYMQLVAARSTKEIKAGSFMGFDKYFQSCDVWDRNKLINSISKLKPTNNVLSVLSKLGNYDRQISTPKQVDTFLSTWNLSEPTKARYLSVIRKVAPKLTEGLSYSQSKGRPDPFQPDEVNRMLNCLPESRKADVRGFISLWLDTGLRTGELAAMDESWVIKDVQKLQVKGAWSAIDKRIKDCKSGHDRVIPLSDSSIKYLLSLQSSSNKDAFFSHMRNPSNFLRRTWKPLLEEAEVRYRKPYCLRHTCASRKIVEYKGDLARVAYEMGHRIDTLAEHYAGVIHTLF